MKTIFHTLLILLLAASTVSAQQKSYNRLKTGDTIPDFELHYMINGKMESLNTRELRGKLVILDFWNIWCSTCIAAMPHMSELQKQFPDDLRIFTITNNSQGQVDGQFNAIATREGKDAKIGNIPSNLGSVVSDTTLHKLFPHQAVPHHIWIGKDGKVRYIASGTDATASAVRDVLNGNDVQLAVKKDTGSFSYNIPLYLDAGGRQLKNLKSYSMIYREVGEYQNAAKAEEVDTVAGMYRFRCLNFTVINMYRETSLDAHNQKFFAPSRLILEVKDSTKLFWPKVEQYMAKWREENLISYDLAIPLSNKKMKNKIMLDALNAMLPYYGRIEKRLVKCMVLVRTNAPQTFISDTPGRRMITHNMDKSLDITNASMDDLVTDVINGAFYKAKTPLVDGTDYKGKISLHISSKTDVKKIRTDLNRYGLDLVEKRLETEMLVISDRQ